MKVILVYSGKGGVGKTTTTVNIAQSLLEQGKRVAILDGDINTPSIPVYFPKENSVKNLITFSPDLAMNF
jgi:Mrp family chromosome partitioning ATPase